MLLGRASWGAAPSLCPVQGPGPRILLGTPGSRQICWTRVHTVGSRRDSAGRGPASPGHPPYSAFSSQLCGEYRSSAATLFLCAGQSMRP